MRNYAPKASREGAGWRDERVPAVAGNADAVPRQELERLEKQLAEQNEKALKQQQEKEAQDEKLHAELQALREQLAEVRAAAEQEPDTHDYSEAETRHYLIDVELKRAGWPLAQQRDREYEVTGMPNAKGIGYVDYCQWPIKLPPIRPIILTPFRSKSQVLFFCLSR